MPGVSSLRRRDTCQRFHCTPVAVVMGLRLSFVKHLLWGRLRARAFHELSHLILYQIYQPQGHTAGVRVLDFIPGILTQTP